jgi:hypothetical protein
MSILQGQRTWEMREVELSANNLCIQSIPEIVTDCTECVVVAYFNPPFH